MSILLNIAVSVATVLASAWGVYNFVPLQTFDLLEIGNDREPRFGLATTSIAATDTLRDSRAVINDNFLYLDRYRIANSTTTLPLLTGVGTITSGTWNGTTIAVANGGTGSTTLAANLVLLGNGTTQVGVVNGTGASGQFLTSNGAGANPSWTTSSVDLAATYAWTGRHTFAAQFGVGTSTPSTGTAGVQNSLNVSGAIETANLTATGTLTWGTNKIPYTAPSTQGALGSALVNNGSGGLSWTEPITQERARVRRTTSISTTSASSTRAAFDAEDFDPSSRHDSGNGRFTVSDNGWYEVFFQGECRSDNDITACLTELYINGLATTTAERGGYSDAVPGFAQWFQNGASLLHLQAGASLEMWVTPTGGGNVSICFTANRCWMYVKKVFDS